MVKIEKDFKVNIISNTIDTFFKNNLILDDLVLIYK